MWIFSIDVCYWKMFWLFSFWIHETGHFLNKICRNKSLWTYHVPKNWVMTEKKMDIVARGFHGKWIKVKRFQKVAFIISPIQRDSREDRCLLVTSLPAHTNCHFSAISGLFWQSFPFFLYIFHKTELQTVILRYWTVLNLNWFKSYDSKCKYIFLDLVNSQNDKWPF